MSSKRLLSLAALIAGIYATLCPIWTLDPADNKAMITMITLGLITAGLALVAGAADVQMIRSENRGMVTNR
jgi:hypothetical protein